MAKGGQTQTPLDVSILDTLRGYSRRGLLPPALDFLKDVTVEDAPALALLRRLAGRSAHFRFLLARIGRVYATCRANRELEAALMRLLEAQQADGRGRLSPGRTRLAEDRKLLRRFFEYLYFASDEFLREVE